MSSRKIPHTGPGHAAGDPGWCEGCAAELEEPAGNNESALREQIARAIHSATERPESICRTGETDWDFLDSDAAEEYRAEADAVLPILHAKVRAAQARADKAEADRDAVAVTAERMTTYARKAEARLKAVRDAIDNPPSDVHDGMAHVEYIRRVLNANAEGEQNDGR